MCLGPYEAEAEATRARQTGERGAVQPRIQAAGSRTLAGQLSADRVQQHLQTMDTE